MNEPKTVPQLEAAFVAECRHKDPPPLDLYLVVSFYVGPGLTTKSWKLHKTEFTSRECAEKYCTTLNEHHLRVAICHLHYDGKENV